MTFIIDEKAPRIRYRDGSSVTFGIAELYDNADSPTFCVPGHS